MDCDIVLVGLNHRTAGVDVRERFALVDFCSRENWALPCDDVIGEAMILSTCNRVELLATGHGDVAAVSWSAGPPRAVPTPKNSGPMSTSTRTWMPCGTCSPWLPAWTP